MNNPHEAPPTRLATTHPAPTAASDTTPHPAPTAASDTTPHPGDHSERGDRERGERAEGQGSVRVERGTRTLPWLSARPWPPARRAANRRPVNLRSGSPRTKNRRTPPSGNRRTRVLTFLAVATLVLAAVIVAGALAGPAATTTHLDATNQSPSWRHLFGTDRLGRDMLARTLVGLRLSLVVGTAAALTSSAIAVGLTCISVTTGRWGRAAVNWLVDLFLALPHLVLLLLLAFAMGGGTRAVIIAVAVTHWPGLTRVLQAQARTVITAPFVETSRALGTGRFMLARKHLAPHLLPHVLVGTVLMFPHAILHEAALSFLGLGIDPSQPAIGILLSQSMKVLSAGMWWLALLPGICLLLLVKLVDSIGENLRSILDPRSYHL